MIWLKLVIIIWCNEYNAGYKIHRDTKLTEKQISEYTIANISRLKSIGYYKKITPLKDAVMDYEKNYLMGGLEHLAELDTD